MPGISPVFWTRKGTINRGRRLFSISARVCFFHTVATNFCAFSHWGRSGRGSETGGIYICFLGFTMFWCIKKHFYEELDSQNIHYQFLKNLIQAYLRAIHECLAAKVIILLIICSTPCVHSCDSFKTRLYIYSVEILELSQNYLKLFI